MTADTTTTTGTRPTYTRVYWCKCGWSGTGLPAMQEHLDRFDDGTDAHTEMAES
jgi:hypothetical protein